MKIVIDCQPLVHNCVHSTSSAFIIKCHQHLLKKDPQIKWLFVADKIHNYILKEIPAENIVSKKILQNRIGWKLWYDYQLPSLIKKQQADLLITTGGISSSCKIPQCVWATGIIENKNKSYFNFFRKRLTKTIDHSKAIFTASQKSEQQIDEQNKVNEKKAIVLRTWPNENFKPLSWAEKESVKTKFAAGKEYFIVIAYGQHKNLINVLKAFSQFKKKLQSNMQLVFAGRELKRDFQFIDKLETFKYRSDVHICSNFRDDEFVKLISSSYGLVYPFSEDEIGEHILNAFNANIPVIISNKGTLNEIAADAALYADLGDIEAITNQMVLLFKDEKMRSQLIGKGKIQLQQTDRDKCMNMLQDAILQAAHQS